MASRTGEKTTYQIYLAETGLETGVKRMELTRNHIVSRFAWYLFFYCNYSNKKNSHIGATFAPFSLELSF